MNSGHLAAAVIAMGIGGGCSMFRLERAPGEVERMFRDMGGPGMGCTAITREAERMARAEMPGGGTIELWIAPTAEGGQMQVTIEKSGDGLSGGGSASCGGGEASGDGITWSGGMASFDDQANTGWSLLSGRAPAGADTVAIVFGEDDSIVTDVQVDGYFMTVQPISSMAEMDTMATPDRIDAIDRDGEVVASLDL